MVNFKTISRIIFDSFVELSLLCSAVLATLFFTNTDYRTCLFGIIIIFLVIIAVTFRIFASELLGDIVSGKILKRLSRFN